MNSLFRMYKIIQRCKLNKFIRLGFTFSNEIISENAPICNEKLIKTAFLNARSNYRYLCSKSEKSQTEMSSDYPDTSAIAGGNEELEHKLKVLILEVEVMRQEGRLVPDSSFLKDHHWKELLNLETISSRRRYLEYLFKTSKKKENRLIKKQEKNKIFEEFKVEVKKENETLEEFAQTYDLRHNNLFLRFYDTTINDMYNNRLIQAIQFGQKLVLDCGYYDKMTTRENINCAKQIMLLFAENRFHDEPFDLHICNSNRDSALIQSLHRHIPPMYEPWFPLNIHESSYLDIFPKSELVYLTPHCREEIREFNHNAVYIIGAIVDKVNNEPLSLAKAKKEGIKMAKLPLDRYLQWGSGAGKSLTLNQVASILLDAKSTGDWKYSFRHVPKRKLVTNLDDDGDNNNRYDLNKIDKTAKTLWRPGKNVDFDRLSYNKNKSRERLIKLRDLMEE